MILAGKHTGSTVGGVSEIEKPREEIKVLTRKEMQNKQNDEQVHIMLGEFSKTKYSLCGQSCFLYIKRV